jgi:hypothetical protein
LPFVTMREYRDRRRDPDARVAVELSRELTRLADHFPRFKLAINKLNYHVLVQVRSPDWKARAILKHLRQDRVASLRELAQRSGLDFVSVTSTLEELRASGRAIACNRAGRPINNPDTKPHWRLGASSRE